MKLRLKRRHGINVDRVHMGNGTPNVTVEVFDPPWYRIDRWIWWLFTRREKSRVQFCIHDITGRARYFDVRCVRV